MATSYIKGNGLTQDGTSGVDRLQYNCGAVLPERALTYWLEWEDFNTKDKGYVVFVTDKFGNVQSLNGDRVGNFFYKGNKVYVETSDIRIQYKMGPNVMWKVEDKPAGTTGITKASSEVTSGAGTPPTNGQYLGQLYVNTSTGDVYAYKTGGWVKCAGDAVLPASTSSDVNKVLRVQADGTPAWYNDTRPYGPSSPTSICATYNDRIATANNFYVMKLCDISKPDASAYSRFHFDGNIAIGNNNNFMGRGFINITGTWNGTSTTVAGCFAHGCVDFGLMQNVDGGIRRLHSTFNVYTAICPSDIDANRNTLCLVLKTLGTYARPLVSISNFWYDDTLRDMRNASVQVGDVYTELPETFTQLEEVVYGTTITDYSSVGDKLKICRVNGNDGRSTEWFSPHDLVGIRPTLPTSCPADKALVYTLGKRDKYTNNFDYTCMLHVALHSGAKQTVCIDMCGNVSVDGTDDKIAYTIADLGGCSVAGSRTNLRMAGVQIKPFLDKDGNDYVLKIAVHRTSSALGYLRLWSFGAYYDESWSEVPSGSVTPVIEDKSAIVASSTRILPTQTDVRIWECVPSCGTDDNGKVLKVVNGRPAWVSAQ